MTESSGLRVHEIRTSVYPVTIAGEQRMRNVDSTGGFLVYPDPLGRDAVYYWLLYTASLEFPLSRTSPNLS